jgi:hypothetical protein
MWDAVIPVDGAALADEPWRGQPWPSAGERGGRTIRPRIKKRKI